MEYNTISTYQDILEHFKLLQVEIDYSRYSTGKPDCTVMIESTQSFTDWHKQLNHIINSIHLAALQLDDTVSQTNNYKEALYALDNTIDELIQLHTEITVSCAHNADLMEGRYLIEHAVGSYLNQINLHINEFRYQLNQLVFKCDGDCSKLTDSMVRPMLLIALTEEIEMKAFVSWITSDNSN